MYVSSALFAESVKKARAHRANRTTRSAYFSKHQDGAGFSTRRAQNKQLAAAANSIWRAPLHQSSVQSVRCELALTVPDSIPKFKVLTLYSKIFFAVKRLKYSIELTRKS